MTIPSHIQHALDRLLDYAMPGEKEHYEEVRNNGFGHIYEDILALRHWLGPVSPISPEYTIGINNDDGSCYDIAVFSGSRPIATLMAPEAELTPLVHAGNCFDDLVSALKEMLRCFASCKPATLTEQRSARRVSIAVVQKATGGSNV